MALSVVHHASSINSLAVPGTFNPGFTPTAGNLILVFLHCNINQSNVTVNTTSWTQDLDVNTGGGSPVQLGMTLWRYAQIGDTSTFPALWTAGTSYTAWEIYEISGVSGTWATDHENSASAFADAGTPTTTLSCSHTTSNANDLCLTGAGQYNGAHNPTYNSGWTLDESANNNGNYGSQASAQQAVATSTAITSTVSFGGSSQPADLMFVTLKLASVGYTLTSAQGSYSLSGEALLFHRTARMTSAQGSYALNGQAASAGHSRTLSATRGVYHLNGKTVAKHHQRRLRANVGRYRYRREVVRLRYNATQIIIFPVDTGEYTLIGEDIVFGSVALRSTFSEFLDTGYLDWNSLGGADYVSYLDTYYLKTDDIMARMTTPYIYVFVENAADASLILNVVKNWAETGNTPEIGTPIQCYHFRDGFLLSVTKNRIRGRGRVMQLRFTSETGKPFNLRGWAAWITQNANP